MFVVRAANIFSHSLTYFLSLNDIFDVIILWNITDYFIRIGIYCFSLINQSTNNHKSVFTRITKILLFCYSYLLSKSLNAAPRS